MKNNTRLISILLVVLFVINCAGHSFALESFDEVALDNSADLANTSESMTETQDTITPEDVTEPEDRMIPEDVTEPENMTEPQDASEPDATTESQDASEPDATIELQDVSEPDDTMESQNVSEPDDTMESQNVSEPDDTTESQDASEPEDVTESQNVSEPDDTTESQDMSEPDDTTESQNVSEPDDTTITPLQQAETSRSITSEDVDPINVVLPLIDTQSNEEDFLSATFDFSVDPYGLIESTRAIRYGGGTVEPGARVIFRNQQGEYDFSSQSDSLTVQNYGETPVRISVTVRADNAENIQLADLEQPHELRNFSLPILCMAIVDNQGNRSVLGQDGTATILGELPAFQNDESPAYSFHLEGSCNPEADWNNTNADLNLSITWLVEQSQMTDLQSDSTPLLQNPDAETAVDTPDAAEDEHSSESADTLTAEKSLQNPDAESAVDTPDAAKAEEQSNSEVL